MNLTKKLIKAHLIDGKIEIGNQLAIRIDQTLTQDATGTMVMLELDAMGIDQTQAELSVQYVDHNQIQEDFKNPDDHVFLQTAAKKFGFYFSKPGNGISHQVHAEQFGIPGKSLLGSDSHTPANGSLGMLAIGSGGLEVALAVCGEPFYFTMPKVVGVQLEGKLPEWVSAKDIILELLRRYDVSGGIGKILEYYGDGLKGLTVMDRHVIANMGAELGVTTSVFPSDEMTRKFLRQMGRESDWVAMSSDGVDYDEHLKIDLGELEPLIALPSSPGNVKRVEEVAGANIFQSYIGSSANPCPRDFAIAAMIIKDKKVSEYVSLDINPSSRQVLAFLTDEGYLSYLIQAGARVHQAGCNGCIGMGQAPATGKISLRTVPRNFPGRSGTKEDRVYLCSPETAIASAITGKITDPRKLNMCYPQFKEPEKFCIVSDIIPPCGESRHMLLEKGPNIGQFPKFGATSDELSLVVALKVGDNISTDDISPAGAKVLPFRSNIEKISEFTYCNIDQYFYERAMSIQNGSILIGGYNYGQGSSREHAAISTRYLGVRIVLVQSFARIHRKNLVNFGVLPLVFGNPEDYHSIDLGDVMEVAGVINSIKQGEFTINNITKKKKYHVHCQLVKIEKEALLVGGLINLIGNKFN